MTAPLAEQQRHFFKAFPVGFVAEKSAQMKRVTFRVDRSRVCNWTFMCLDYLQKSL